MRRHDRSSSRSKRPAARSTASGAGGVHRLPTGAVTRSTDTQPGAAPPSVSTISATLASSGTRLSKARTLPSAPWAKSRRNSAEFSLSFPGRPPQHRLVLGPGEGDVGQAQVFAPLLPDVGAAVVGPAVALVAGQADVDRADVAVAGVVVHRRAALRDVARLPQVRQVHHRELEALAAVDGEDLHRFGVGLQPAAAFLAVGVFFRFGDALAQPGGQRRRPQPLGGGGGVEQLADVAEVGEVAFAAGPGQEPGGETLRGADELEERGHAVAAQHAGPPVEGEVDRLPGVVAGRGHLLRRPPQEGGEGDGTGPRHRRRPLQRLEQPQPLPGDRRGEHAAGAVDDGGDPHGGQRAPHQVGLPVGADQHGHVPGPDLLVAGGGAVAVAALHPGPRRQQPDEVVGQVLRR